ncbi:MAG: dockerin type I domain-containing protein [Gemmatimonadota bacterium]|nr:dockerin type I domain-containing protein [Gemmatimonadota bacterium]
MRFFFRWNMVGLLLLWPAIGHAQLMDPGAAKPGGEGGDPAGAWMADSTALPVWASPAILQLVSNPSIDGTVSGTVKLDAGSGAYETDYVTSVRVALTIGFLNQSIDSTFVDTFKQAGAFSVEDTSLILTQTVEEGEAAVSDTLGFTTRDDSLFLIQVVPLPPQYAGIVANLPGGAPLAILGFAKMEGEPDPPTPPEPPPTGTSADFNGDGSVDFSDFLAFAQNFGRSDGDENYDAKFDLTGDNKVDFSDFLAFAQQFGQKQ